MVYTKRTYKDVKDTFEWEFSGKILFKKWTSVGVNSLGIWLQPINEEQPYGFFEWSWIKVVLVDTEKDKLYFVMHDMDAVYENVVLWFPKIAFKAVIRSVGNLKAFKYDITQDVSDALVYAVGRGWVELVELDKEAPLS